MTFRYEGFTASGKAKMGNIDAETEGEASERIIAAGINLMKLEPLDANQMKTTLHHEAARDESEFFDSSEEQIIDRPRIHSPSEGQNYPSQPEKAWQPSWRNVPAKTKASQSVARTNQTTPREIDSDLSFDPKLADEIHSIARFYLDCQTVVQQSRTGNFPDLLKESLKNTCSALVESALRKSWIRSFLPENDEKTPKNDQKQVKTSPKTKKPSKSEGSSVRSPKKISKGRRDR